MYYFLAYAMPYGEDIMPDYEKLCLRLLDAVDQAIEQLCDLEPDLAVQILLRAQEDAEDSGVKTAP